MPQKYFFLVLILSLILVISPTIIYAASGILYFSPSLQTVAQGESFWLTIMVDTKGDAINAVAVYFSYPEDKLEPLGVSIEGSTMSIWAEKEAKAGKVKISGGLPTPGFSGIKKIASVGFKPKVNSGSVTFKFNTNSAVLRNSDNINILNLTNSGQGEYAFKAASSTQEPKPKETKLLISDINIETNRQGAVVSWKTNKESGSVVEYGPTADYGFATTSDALTKEHSLTISELFPGITYHYKIKGMGAAGETAETKDLIFTTSGYTVEITVLDPSDNRPSVGAEVTFFGITKTTDETGKVIFDNFPLGRQQISVKYKNDTLNHSINVVDKEGIQSFEVRFQKLTPGVAIAIIVFAILAVALLIFAIVKTIKSRKDGRQIA